LFNRLTVGSQRNFKLEFQFCTILSINPQPEGKNPYSILIGIIIAVLLVTLMGKPTGLKWTGDLQ